MTSRKGTTAPKEQGKGLRVKKETVRDLSAKQKGTGIKGGAYTTRLPTSYGC